MHNGNSLKGAGSSSRISAKFEKSEGEPPLDSPNAITPSTLPAQLEINQEEVEEEEDDRFLFLDTSELHTASGFTCLVYLRIAFLDSKLLCIRVE